MVLHLRYPNAHTQWFSSLLLYLFMEVRDDCFREILTRVLLERFIVHRPHPWGALATFIELLRNPKYAFWSKEFTRIAPEVTLLLESVSIASTHFSVKMFIISVTGRKINFPTVEFPLLRSSQSFAPISLFYMGSRSLHSVL